MSSGYGAAEENRPLAIEDAEKGHGQHDDEAAPPHPGPHPGPARGGAVGRLAVPLAAVATLLFWLLVVAWLGAVTLGAKGADATAQGFSWAAGDKRVFNWHPVLMAGGFVLCLGHATLVHSVPSSVLAKPTRKWVHATLLACVVPLVALGLVAVFRSHNEAVPPIPNMYSAHAYLGALVITLFLCQLAYGAYAFALGGMPAEQRAAALPQHRWAGVAIFELACVTAAMGLVEKMAFNGTGGAKGAEMQVTNAATLVLVVGMAALPGAVALRDRSSGAPKSR